MSDDQQSKGTQPDAAIAELETLVGEVAETGAMVHGSVLLKPPEKIPLHFDERYRFEKNLGRGGMGEVKLYWDQQIGRPVAIKTIRPDRAAATDLEARFLRVRRASSSIHLSSPFTSSVRCPMARRSSP